MRKLFYAALALPLILAVFASSALANPKGLRGPDVGKKLFNFNVIIHPQGWNGSDDAVCNNNGHRIFFVEQNGGTDGRIYWNLNETVNQSFSITDCDGTTDGDANVVVNQSQDIYVAVRLVGPANSLVRIICDEIVNEQGSEICLIDDVTINKGNSFTKIMKSILDAENEFILWELDFQNNGKILQVWVMEAL